MIFGKRRNHPLPRFPDTVAPTFRRLCERVPASEAAGILAQVDQCMDGFRELARDHHRLNLSLAEKVAERCRYLLNRYSDYDHQQQALIMGAVRYFAIAEDAMAETEFATGFDDDARVMNYVLEELGLDELYIAIR